MNFDFFGNKIELGWNHIFVLIAGFFVGGLVLLVVDSILLTLGMVISDMSEYTFLELVEDVVYSANTLIAATAIFVIGKRTFKKIDKNTIKSLCAGYAIIQFVLVLLLVPLLRGYLLDEWFLFEGIVKIFVIISGSALLYLWLTILNEWNRKKINKAISNGLLLAAATSLLVSAFWYVYEWDSGLGLDAYYNIIANFISLTFIITPVVYYLLDKKMLGKIEYFFLGAYILQKIIAYFTHLEFYYMSYSLAALAIVYIWWIQQK